jgi:hypothetical protein
MKRRLTKKDFKIGLICSITTSLVLFSALFLIDELRQSKTYIALLLFNTIISLVISIEEYRELYK